MELLQSFPDMYRMVKNSSCPLLTFPDEANAVPSCFSSYTINKGAFRGLFSVTFFAFLCFLFDGLLFKMVPKHSAEVVFLSTRKL